MSTRTMKLTIDGETCNLNAEQRVRLSYHADELQELRRARKGFTIRLTLPATPTNDKVFGRATDPRAATAFNDTVHTAVFSVDGSRLVTGPVRLLSAETDDPEHGTGTYTVEISGRTPTWNTYIATRMLSDLAVPFVERLSPATIVNSWTNSSGVKFFPIHHESRPAAPASGVGQIQRMLSVDDYHPFIRLQTAVNALFHTAGYTLKSAFINASMFGKLYMSGAYASRDTTTMRRNMDFLARRTTNASTTADSIGRVYAQPHASANSIRGIVQTVNPNDTDQYGQALSDAFSNNRCFTVEGGECRFTPTNDTTVGFEFHIHYLTGHRIASRTRLSGIDGVYLGDGTDVRMELPNPYVDRVDELRPNTTYRAVVFDHVPGQSYLITTDANGASFGGQFFGRSQLVTTLAHNNLSTPILFYTPVGSSTFIPYPGDWALYDSWVGETGQSEVEMTLHTNPVAMSAGETKHFSGIYFYGGDPGTSFTLLSDTSLRPDFSSAPGLNSEIFFADIARHNIRQWELLDALRHLFNWRIFTDEESKTVYIEPSDRFYTLGAEVDWSDKIDASQPIVVRDLAQEMERTRTYRYRAGDRAVTRVNEALGQWTFVNDSAAAIDDEKSVSNPLFAPTVNETGCYPNAPSARVMRIDEGDGNNRHAFTPRLVYYAGMERLPEGERWGFPHNTNNYPLAFFSLANGLSTVARNGFTLTFENLNAQVAGLRTHYNTELWQYRTGKEITLYLHLEPNDIENLFHLGTSAASVASVFRLRIDNSIVECTLRSIDDYDPISESTRCVFITLN